MPNEPNGLLTAQRAARWFALRFSELTIREKNRNSEAGAFPAKNRSLIFSAIGADLVAGFSGGLLPVKFRASDRRFSGSAFGGSDALRDPLEIEARTYPV